METPAQKKPVYLLGRLSKNPIYQVQVPLDWEKNIPEIPSKDTKDPIATFYVDQVTISIHNFPTQKIEDRIYPEAQIERWKDQKKWEVLDTSPYTNGGFGGFFLEAYTKDGQGCFAYALQLTPSLFRAISENEIDKKADYTIKVTGPSKTLQDLKTKIEQFADSFEWIEPIPLCSVF